MAQLRPVQEDVGVALPLQGLTIDEAETLVRVEAFDCARVGMLDRSYKS